jgi:selenocysteine lyase/cysteine desulfurase
VLPFYGNTHTTTTVTSLQTTHFRHEARDIIRNAVNASEHDSVIFCGNGCTGAVHKLINSLDLKLTEGQQPVVFVGPFEHHSNILPWREAGAKVIRIGEAEDGTVDLEDLELQLKKHHSSSCLLIGCFSAASNITGILTDTIAVTLLLRKYNALSFWDYATAGPYIKIDMNPVVDGVSEPLVSKDAIFLSPHKFVGGTGCPGTVDQLIFIVTLKDS